MKKWEMNGSDTDFVQLCNEVGRTIRKIDFLNERIENDTKKVNELIESLPQPYGERESID